jgi:hemerythrin
MSIEWRDSLSVGVEAIDSQHKELLHRFDRLLNACQEGQGIHELHKMQMFLDEYVHTHFNDEEALQRQKQYPGFDAHHAEHLYFIEQLNKLTLDIQKEGASTHHVIETNHFLLKWLLNHISKVDKELGVYLKSCSP